MSCSPLALVNRKNVRQNVSRLQPVDGNCDLHPLTLIMKNLSFRRMTLNGSWYGYSRGLRIVSRSLALQSKRFNQHIASGRLPLPSVTHQKCHVENLSLQARQIITFRW
ncbi:hypothetical protein AVEN_234461-1 [Araneus ventricosus]|uniref:Uncharacterized protein n=1 Tax=Araneus ventricosus TaxID=182803 RepID=A0A4Y2AB66_ARAVE|nr:hypothetical protein AVEN_234461-1 [Araneus ventricosus]